MNTGYEFTADQWRDGTYLRGETFHLWLTELKDKYGLDYGLVYQFYQDIRFTYMQENDIEEIGDLHNSDYVKINQRIEIALENYSKHPEEYSGTIRRKKRPNRIIRLFMKLFR